MAKQHAKLHIDDLPNELLLQVLAQLSKLPPVPNDHDSFSLEMRLPFKTHESLPEEHPGLRAYPFLAQVSKRWRDLLMSPSAQPFLWKSLIIDFSHELITSVHTPVAWSNQRPDDTEFRTAFSTTRLNAYRMIEFARMRKEYIQKLVLMHSEGYWADDNEFVNLSTKHNFGLAHFGLLLGMLGEGLTELQLAHCNDLFGMGSPLGVIAALPNIRILKLEGLHCRLYKEPVAELGRMTTLVWLSICSMERNGMFIFGIDSIPDTWQQLRHLRGLELRGNALMEQLPDWMPAAMPKLQLLDVSHCYRLDLAKSLRGFSQLTTLVLQGLSLFEAGCLPSQLQSLIAGGAPQPRIQVLPDLAHLTGLKALDLSGNSFSAIPDVITRLTNLQYLNFSDNVHLKVLSPATNLAGALKQLRWLDLRRIFLETSTYWTADKCTTMQHVAALAKTLKRRQRRNQRAVQLLYDTG